MQVSCQEHSNEEPFIVTVCCCCHWCRCGVDCEVLWSSAFEASLLLFLLEPTMRTSAQSADSADSSYIVISGLPWGLNHTACGHAQHREAPNKHCQQHIMSSCSYPSEKSALLCSSWKRRHSAVLRLLSRKEKESLAFMRNWILLIQLD